MMPPAADINPLYRFDALSIYAVEQAIKKFGKIHGVLRCLQHIILYEAQRMMPPAAAEIKPELRVKIRCAKHAVEQAMIKKLGSTHGWRMKMFST
jgi:hypothetical protein